MISIIVTVYNSEKYLEKCLNSIINQSYKDIEIILVNDGSCDNSIQICKNYKALDSRIKIINSIKNEGIVESRKKGVKCALGDYITFVDSDDWIEEDTYKHIMDLLNQKMPDLVAYGMKEEKNGKVIEKKNSIIPGYFNKESIYDILKQGCLYNNTFFEFGILPNLCCKLIKKEIFINKMNDVSPNITVGEDVDFFYRMMPEFEDMVILDYTPYHYIQYDNSMMRQNLSFQLIKDLYYDLISISSFGFMKQEWNNQVLIYILFVTLLKCPIVLFEKMTELKSLSGKIVIYGAGDFGMIIYNYLIKQKEVVNIKVVDQNWEKIQRKEFPVYNPNEIIINDDIMIIGILNEKICKSIKDRYVKEGYKKIIYFEASEKNIREMKKLMI